MSVRKVAEVLNLAPGTVLRWIEDGFIPAEQPTPGAPWQIRLTDDLLSRFVEKPPPGPCCADGAWKGSEPTPV